MRTLIVYESMFGSTRDIAWAIAEGLSPALQSDVVDVNTAPPAPDADVDLLVVGAPTHLFGLSRPRTRVAAARRAAYPLVSASFGLRDWLGALPPTAQRRDALAFETRLRAGGFPGSAAKGAAKRLRKRGYRMLWPSQTFYLGKVSGPPAEWEIERARQWGRWIREGIEVNQARV